VGRHKQFERGEVTDKALRVFWRKGYLDTSLKDLEEATGIFKPALYAEFGDKAGMFLECIKYYRTHYARERLLRREPLGWRNIEDFLKPHITNQCEKSCFEVDVFSRDIPILERDLNRSIDKAIDHIPPLIKNNLKHAGLDSAKLDILTTTIFTFYCGLSTLAKSQSEANLEKQAVEFLNFIRS